MARETKQTSAFVKAILKINDLHHFDHYWFSTDDVAKIMRHVFSLPRCTKIFSDSILIDGHLSHHPPTKYGIDMDNNNIDIYIRIFKFNKDEENRKIVKCLYFCKPNKVINKLKDRFKYYDEIEELIPNRDLVLGNFNCT